jgi:histidinol-phosphatase
MIATMDTLLEACAEVARVAGGVALRHYRETLTIETKSDGSPVTRADREAEEAARAWIAARFPGDAILGEEFSETGGGPRRWLIDPIDGTKSFVRGVPLWGTMIAVAEGETVLAGAVYCAAAGDLMVAARGAGCWWNGVRCKVSGVTDLARATVLTTDDRFPGRERRRARWARLAARVDVVRTWGDCFGYLAVARGHAEAMVDDRLSPWDAAAVQVIVEEAGGRFSDWRGRATAFGADGMATNAALAEEIRAALGVADDEDPDA